MLLAISEELPKFKSVLDAKQMTAVLPLFLSLLGCEETVVRESTVEGLRKLVPSFTDEQVPLLKELPLRNLVLFVLLLKKTLLNLKCLIAIKNS